MPRRSKLARVALAFPVVLPWRAQCMQGIRAYAQEHGDWNLLTSPPTLITGEEVALTPTTLAGWRGDGVIAVIDDRREARQATMLKIPIVCLNAAFTDLDLPRVIVSHRAMGRLAAEHLLQCGFRRLAFFGIRGPRYAAERRDGFLERAAEAGIRCEVFEEPASLKRRGSWTRRLAPLDHWLGSLKTPVGILAVHDYRARILLEECRAQGLEVPHDVAVLGVENDTVICETCQPTLSSVSRNAFRHGYEAAALLHQLMTGRSPPRREVVIPPEGVVARRSTDTIALEDPHVRTVVHYLHDHLERCDGVRQAAAEVPISRRLLEKRFRRYMACTPYDYLCRIRVDKARRLLASDSTVKMLAVARACGFTSPDRMRIVFSRCTGQTPTEYRRLMRKSAKHQGIQSRGNPPQPRMETSRRTKPL